MIDLFELGDDKFLTLLEVLILVQIKVKENKLTSKDLYSKLGNQLLKIIEFVVDEWKLRFCDE
jgi:hypothetical protein